MLIFRCVIMPLLFSTPDRAPPPLFLAVPTLRSPYPLRQAGVAPLIQSLSLLAIHLSVRPAIEIQANRASAFELFLSSLAFRAEASVAAQYDLAGLAEATRVVEAVSGDVLLQLTVKLNEVQFRPLFLRALAWVTGESTALAEATPWLAAESTAFTEVAPTRISVLRAISFYRALAPSQAKLAGLYTAYFQLALPHATALLQPVPATPEVPHPVKRQRLSDATDESAVIGTDGERDRPSDAELAICLRSTLTFTRLGLLHGGTAAAALAQLHALEGPLLARLADDDMPLGNPLDSCQREVPCAAD